MNQQELYCLFEDQDISETETFNIFDIKPPSSFFQNKIGLFFSSSNNIEEYQIIEELKKAMEESESEKGKSEINEESSFKQKKKNTRKKDKQKKVLQSSFNTAKNISTNEEKNTVTDSKQSCITKAVNFKTVLHHKRGRKGIENKNNKYYNKYHGSAEFDNVQRKIQVSFINFLIRLANDAIKAVFGKNTKYFFKDVKYEFKKVVNHKYVEYLKQCKYSDIIQMKISAKNKKLGPNLNKETLEEICKLSPQLQKLFDQNYLYLFQKYYCTLKNEQEILDFEGLKIELSPLTRGFPSLLKKNENSQERYNNVVKDVYFSDLNYINYTNENKNNKSSPFITTKIELKE